MDHYAAQAEQCVDTIAYMEEAVSEGPAEEATDYVY